MKFFKDLREKLQAIYEQTTALIRLFPIVNNIQITINKLHEIERKKAELSVMPPLLVVARHTLGSIDVSDLDDPDKMEDDAYTEYTARAMQFLPFFEKEAKHAMKLQHDFWFTKAESWDQTMFGRGTTNGIQVMLDRFEKLKANHMQKIKREEEPALGSREDILAKLQVGSETIVNEDKK